MTTELITGQRYQILYKTRHGGPMKCAVLDYIGQTEREFLFSARPQFGTQTMARDWVISIAPVSTDTPIKIR